MPPLLLVMVGGALGAGLRYQISRIALYLWGPDFPWGTWIINLSGGFLMGTLVGTLAGSDPEMTAPIRLLLATGVLGGFTTFSAFSLDTFGMLQNGQHGLAAVYAVTSVVGSVMLLVLGLLLGKALS
ncbi:MULTISPECIES: fluoride efflux transporter CrcB [Sphingomonas]|uniref:Fluoride-specific ion channel FluC n=1 Tax=Edaphosphingomonas fennica TaxID=114404 RepID=A0A2T4HPB7_9SPHN|nr:MULTISPECIES: fluoride efflux transporter CrcB [Sphingomonas]MDX3883636.1 fluoride efflux transporter CrcB [Sphingomonas sp.]PTD17645.1 fluoride efflux transporter CrcB [Sphingomonas fennica]